MMNPYLFGYSIIALVGGLLTVALAAADLSFTLRRGAMLFAGWLVWPLVILFLVVRGLSDLVDEAFFSKKGAK